MQKRVAVVTSMGDEHTIELSTDPITLVFEITAKLTYKHSTEGKAEAQIEIVSQEVTLHE